MADLKTRRAEQNLKKESSMTESTDTQRCPVTTAIDVIGGKWKVIILYQLRGKTLRFGELKRSIPRISQKMLTHQLRELEADKLITRQVYAEVPPKVEYTSTDLAEKLNSALDLLCEWGGEYNKVHQA